MFSFEEGASEIIETAIDRYEAHFKRDFPLNEFIRLTYGKEYDFSLEGAQRLDKLIKDRINANKPVKIPTDYDKRLY